MHVLLDTVYSSFPNRTGVIVIYTIKGSMLPITGDRQGQYPFDFLIVLGEAASAFACAANVMTRL